MMMMFSLVDECIKSVPYNLWYKSFILKQFRRLKPSSDVSPPRIVGMADFDSAEDKS